MPKKLSLMVALLLHSSLGRQRERERERERTSNEKFPGSIAFYEPNLAASEGPRMAFTPTEMGQGRALHGKIPRSMQAPPYLWEVKEK